MIIDQLPTLQLPVEDTDEIAIERGQLLFKVPMSEVGAGGGIEDRVEALETDVSDLNAAINTVVLQAAVQTISGNGTSSALTLTGLTADHVVASWGMFSDAACTTPIPENAPTCDITITTAADAWTYTIENFSSTFYLRPTFVLKQN